MNHIVFILFDDGSAVRSFYMVAYGWKYGIRLSNNHENMTMGCITVYSKANIGCTVADSEEATMDIAEAAIRNNNFN